MRRPLAMLLALGRRVRLAGWTARGRARMRWVGIRLEVDAGPGVVFVRAPSLLAGSEEPTGAPGSLRIVLGRNVRLAAGVIVEAEPGRDSVLEIGDGTRVGSNVHFHLRGGAVRVGRWCEVRDGCVLKASGGQIDVGDNCLLSYGCVLHARERVEVGGKTVLAERVTVVDSTHDTDGSDVHWAEQAAPSAAIRVGENTVVYANVVVTMGAQIGANSQVAAGALVRGEHPDAALLAGVPAEVVRMLGEDE